MCGIFASAGGIMLEEGDLKYKQYALLKNIGLCFTEIGPKVPTVFDKMFHHILAIFSD